AGDTGAGPDGTNSPAQIRRLPQDRSTRAKAPCDSTAPPGRVVDQMSPTPTCIDVSTRPVGDRASTAHGRSGSEARSNVESCPRGFAIATGCPLMTSVTARVVPFEIPRLGSDAPDEAAVDGPGSLAQQATM